VDSPSSAVHSSKDQARPTVSKYLGNKECEWNRVSERKGPLTLLELPVDILRLIVKEASPAASVRPSVYSCCRYDANERESHLDHTHQRPHLARAHQFYLP
jgi:hypothetical protein